MIELTEEQRQELANPEPMVRDPQTKETYALVRADVYERLKAFLDELPDGGPLINEVMAEDDANDPLLESYQRHAKETP